MISIASVRGCIDAEGYALLRYIFDRQFPQFDEEPRLKNKYLRKGLTLIDMTSGNEYVLGRGYVAALRYMCQSRTNILRSTYIRYVD